MGGGLVEGIGMTVNICSFLNEDTQVEIPVLSLLGICKDANIYFVSFLTPSFPTYECAHFWGKLQVNLVIITHESRGGSQVSTLA